MKSSTTRLTVLSAAISACMPVAAFAQLEEIIVTATRRVTDLQSTPLSIQAFTAEQLEYGGIQQGQDLGIMVPNVVLNPGTGQSQSDFYIRGLPGVGIYIDGVWQGGNGFQQTNFIEMERVEVLRGPQGTLFGRNTNGGAVNMTTRRPADEFGARVKLDAGEFNRRDITLAVDLPFSDTLKTKWTAGSYQNDGFLQGLTSPRGFGDQDDTLFRADILWEPTDNFSLRFTANDESKASTDARIVQFTNTSHPRYLGYNVACGNPDFLAAARAVDPAWPDPPSTPCRSTTFTPETHEPGYPGGQVGKWQTKTDTMNDGIKQDVEYYTLTLDWDITDNITLESITSGWERDGRQVIDFDGSEFVITTDDIRAREENTTQEFHLTGSHKDGRIDWLAGLYYLDQKSKTRFYRWGLWEFTIPNVGPSDPAQNIALRDYVRAYGTLLNIPTLVNYVPITFITDDALSASEDEDSAFFGEVTFGVTDRLDLTLGVRVTADDGRSKTFTETDGFRAISPLVEPIGDPFGGVVDSVSEDADLGNITTNKFALTYQVNDDIMLYGSWGEGFTSGGINFVNNVGFVELQPEIVTTREIGLRSDWAGGRFRFNATYFDSDWEGMRVQNLPPDPQNPGQRLPFPYPSSDGKGIAEGWEFDMTWLPTDQLRLNLGLGIIDTNYLERGFFDGINGIGPRSRFAYAPDNSASLGIQYDMPMSNGGHVMLIGQYGWMDKYTRDAANQRTPVDANGNYIFEPAYGIFNARVVYEPSNRDWNFEVWGRNLTDEQYINGGFDTRTVWGYDFTVIGRSREVGIGIGFEF